MGKLLFGMTMSLDVFVNDRNGDVSGLYPDLDALRKTEMLQDLIRTTGAVVMGRHAYNLADGDFTDYEFQVSIFILTHHVPERVARAENERFKFNFITDGIESAVNQAKVAAGVKNVTVIGGANIVEQLQKARLIDEIQIGIVPVLLGEGLRLFEHLGRYIDLENTRTMESLGVTYLSYRVVN